MGVFGSHFLRPNNLPYTTTLETNATPGQLWFYSPQCRNESQSSKLRSILKALLRIPCSLPPPYITQTKIIPQPRPCPPLHPHFRSRISSPTLPYPTHRPTAQKANETPMALGPISSLKKSTARVIVCAPHHAPAMICTRRVRLGRDIIVRGT